MSLENETELNSSEAIREAKTKKRQKKWRWGQKQKRLAALRELPLPACEDCGQNCSHPLDQFCIECKREKKYFEKRDFIPTPEHIAAEAAKIRAERDENWVMDDYVNPNEECEEEARSKSSKSRSYANGHATESISDPGAQEVSGT